MMTRGTTITLEDFRRDLASIVPDNDSVIVVHSGLWRFANTLDIPRYDVPDVVIDALLDLAGPERTVVMPTYTFDFPRTRKYDLKRDKPSTGVIVEAFLKRPGVRRSTSPINSYAAVGPETEALLACPCSTAWGRDSVMGWLYEADARFVSLGVHSLLSCSYYHTVEEWERVPYRYFKRFTGTLYDDSDEVGPCEEVLYVRPMGIAQRFLGTHADERLEGRGLKTRPEQPDGAFMESMSMRDIIEVSEEVVREEPYAMIVEEDREAVKAWVAEGNLEHEIASMSPEQRFEQGNP